MTLDFGNGGALCWAGDCQRGVCALASAGVMRKSRSSAKNFCLADQVVVFALRYDRTHPERRLIGYARGQTLDSQLEQLRKAGCNSRNIHKEKVTGARPDRRELNRMLGKLAPGDVVTVTRIDRLARSTLDLFGIVKRIADAKAQFRSLAEPWADTGTSTGRLMLTVLGGLADVERDLIRTRTAEGRSRAKAQGKHMGRPPALTPAQQKEGHQTSPSRRRRGPSGRACGEARAGRRARL